MHAFQMLDDKSVAAIFDIYCIQASFIFTGVFLPLHKCMQTTVFCPNLNFPRQGCVRNIAVIDLSTFDCDESKMGANTIFVMVVFLPISPGSSNVHLDDNQQV